MQIQKGLWRTCRVIASKTRLQILWHLFEKGELTVSECSQLTRMSLSNTSFQLKMLCESGLVIFRREKMEVFYRAEANGAVKFAPDALAALRNCYDRGVSFKTVIYHATAFTHERRIEIFRALHGRSLSAQALQESTGMSSSAFSRHLNKLVRRGYVKRRGGICRIGGAGNALGRTLLKLATRSPNRIKSV